MSLQFQKFEIFVSNLQNRLGIMWDREKYCKVLLLPSEVVECFFSTTFNRQTECATLLGWAGSFPPVHNLYGVETIFLTMPREIT